MQAPLYDDTVHQDNVKFISSLFRLQVKDKADEVQLLSDTLASEHKKSRELQCALATEKAKAGHCEERDKELKVLSLCVLQNSKL